VRQGEKSTLVSFWKFSEFARENETGELEKKTSVLLLYYRVFNVEQCDGLRAIYGDDRKPVNPIAECESIANHMPNAPRIEQHSQAFYRPSADIVGMPSRSCFESPEAYYSTLFHELAHATGHKSRLNRFEENVTDHQFGSESYSKEELVAEISAAMLSGNRWHFARDSRQFRELPAIVDHAPKIRFTVDYLGCIARAKSRRFHSRQNSERRGRTMSTPTFAFPQPLAEKYRPRTIADFVGLDRPKRILSRFAAHPYQSAWLFAGPPGIGKTSMAPALAETLRAELHHIPSQQCNVANVEDVIRQCWYVPTSGGFHLVLADEADRMSNAAQLHFLSKLDATAFPPQTIFVFTCNTTDGLEPRFLSRTRQIEFSSYGLAGEATRLLETIWQREANSTAAPNFARNVKESSNNVRDALMCLETELLAS